MQINKFINKKKGLPSFCTSNVDVLKTIFFFCQTNKFPCLIESTSNQVNQFGGYTNKTPRMFYKNKSILSKKFNLKKNLFLGGDHLGPLPFKNQNSNKAIINSIRLINNYLKSDFCKIHIDTSIKCKNDREINQKIIFERTKKILTKINLKKKIKKIFLVIGTEVPLSGSNEKGKISITEDKQIMEEVKQFKKLLLSLYNRKVKFALVIEPGMRYMHHTLTKPKFSNFKLKRNFSLKNNFVYEAHSTDYQNLKTLKNLTKNNFKFLKVGPELTFRYSRSLLFMRKIEEKFISDKKSNFETQIVKTMLSDNKYWKDYYTAKNLKIKKRLILNSKLDRMRYYFNDKKIIRSIHILRRNINKISRENIEKFLKYIDLNKKFKNLTKSGLSNFEIIVLLFLSETLKKYYRACGYKL